ncbi:DUF6371 domain-containing protein [Spirosoma aerophilum]
MPATTQLYRYKFPKKAIKVDCPQCGPRHRKTLSRYIDTKTGEVLPETYGRCDRESNCGYSLSPYQKTATGLSYADEQKQPAIPKTWFHMAGKQKRNHVQRSSVIQCLMDMQGATLEQAERVVNYVFDKPAQSARSTQVPVIYTIPDEIIKQSLSHYQQNQFARLLVRQFGQTQADELLQRFQVGTSSRWPGACVFWLTDEHCRTRSGQVVLFTDDWHKANYTNQEGNKKVCISSVSYGLMRRYAQQQQQPPDWLTNYHDKAPRWPVLFGLQQLAIAPVDQPVAIVEAPKTAIICSALIPGFLWLAVGALSYLNAERIAPLRSRSIMLFPDLSKDGKAFARWSKVADELNNKGYQIRISDYLEQRASKEQKIKGFDLADFLLMTDRPSPRWIRDGLIIYGEVLDVEIGDDYPAEWDI